MKITASRSDCSAPHGSRLTQPQPPTSQPPCQRQEVLGCQVTSDTKFPPLSDLLTTFTPPLAMRE